MKTKRIYQGIALLAMALTTAACQNELNEDTTQLKTGEKVNMIIRATQGTTPQTRTEYEDKLGVGTTGSVVVKWEGGNATDAPVEKIKVFGYAADAAKFTTPQELSSTPTSLSKNGLSIDFAGTVTQADNYLAVYPASNCTLDGEGFINFTFLDQEQDCTTGKELAHLKTYDIMLGKLETTGTNNYTFEHKAIMLRFDLTLPTAESVNKVTLATSIIDGIATDAYISIDNAESLNRGTVAQEISLDITNHSPSATLKAYMMVPHIDVDDATLTLTVVAANGKAFVGKLKTDAGTELKAGLCYTLTPTLALTKTITVPPVTEGGLGEALAKITPVNGQTDLVVTGAVNETDITALADFLEDEKSKNITLLDLSGITNMTEVKGFANCVYVETVILPDNAEAIGDNAFEGCTALTTITQNETTPITTTRASMPSRVKTVGKEAFKNCTAMAVMFLHVNITSVGANAFDGCTALQALVFEGTWTVGTGADKINLGATILANCTQEGLNILLPFITDATKAATYKKALGRPTYYECETYSDATDEDKVKPESYYESVSDGSSVGDFKPGGSLGQ